MTISTTYGPVVGTESGGIRSFKGIPYARAPFGDLRFRAPVAPEPWTEPFVADRFGATSPQKQFANAGGLPEVPEPIIPGDDILNLNVWTPEGAEPGSLPVLVWIHGGGFFAGCSANPWYDGAAFARKGLVVVSLNYRLAYEGFLDLEGGTTNNAVLDWITALTWVQENVTAFGGNPAEVTLMGQSAGAMAVTALLSSTRTSGLFARAIIASGISRSAVRSKTSSLARSEKFAGLLGERPERGALASHAVEEYIAAQDVFDETAGDLESTLGGEMALWLPVVDGDLVESTAIESVLAGRGSDIPLLVGTTENEFAWSLRTEEPTSEEARVRGQHLTDRLFRKPTDDFVEARGTASAPTYRYEFQWKSTADPIIGSGHSIDIPFFFNNLDAPYVTPYTGENPPQELADRVHAGFANFALTGDPGWPAYHDGDERSVMIFDTESRIQDGVRFE
jgi:para-nitrobenzyl esterase